MEAAKPIQIITPKQSKDDDKINFIEEFNINAIRLYDLDYKGCKSCFHCKKIGGKYYEVATDAEFLRQAMDEAEGLTYDGTESDFGMMVETVNGEQAIYAEDNAYWAFYVDGEYGQYGIDSQPVEDGVTYSIVYEAA